MLFFVFKKRFLDGNTRDLNLLEGIVNIAHRVSKSKKDTIFEAVAIEL